MRISHNPRLKSGVKVLDKLIGFNHEIEILEIDIINK